MRGLVQIDAVDGTVMGEYTEPNPEDWSKYGLDEAAGQSVLGEISRLHGVAAHLAVPAAAVAFRG